MFGQRNVSVAELFSCTEIVTLPASTVTKSSAGHCRHLSGKTCPHFAAPSHSKACGGPSGMFIDDLTKNCGQSSLNF
ncbi:hypothetical protein E2C01_047792 [Portunus trituberculatus]|uniref:Uncharacterized protein n=1 Tax=Portunus trituberculatus TaxID=210409 RepID=A0A5B7G8F4_PORTR|nr:hypothetical protein [Portunus trituberculatus]